MLDGPSALWVASGTGPTAVGAVMVGVSVEGAVVGTKAPPSGPGAGCVGREVPPDGEPEDCGGADVAGELKAGTAVVPDVRGVPAMTGALNAT